MIKYSLKCGDGHVFESWFASSEAYDTLRAAGHVACVACGSGEVSKSIMAPRVATARSKIETTAAADEAPVPGPLNAPISKAETALARMRDAVEKNATYVGGNFAKEARDMYLGDTPDRPIWGEANAKEAKALIEDGVPVAPLPFLPTRKAN
ncbi:DUF1178 family protein [uncultured Tateyamaria sp.]|uniref:DUF1178 family protein n=1 Tax=uncultured Tateyamaria sp. TaxID=455651 RepID=UPI002633548C|nr:DUF1178 family protein [uncultured Tateyamaria sp.]